MLKFFFYAVIAACIAGAVYIWTANPDKRPQMKEAAKQSVELIKEAAESLESKEDFVHRVWYACKCVSTNKSAAEGRVCAASKPTAEAGAKSAWIAAKKTGGSIACECAETNELCKKSKGDDSAGF